MSVPMNNLNQGGYNPNAPPIEKQPGFAPPPAMYPHLAPGSEGGYNPTQGGYPQPQGGYQPPQGGFPPPQGGFPPTQGGYPPPQGGYAPPGGYVPPGYQPVPTQPYVPGGQGQPDPAQSGWMTVPTGIPNCPRGLEYLTTIDQLLVKQKVELLEAIVGFETNNKYTIKNSLGQKVYWAVEENDCCTRNCCGPLRPMDIKIMDIYKNEVIHINRPLRCDSCCFPCCLQEMEISAPPGNVIGTIEQEWSILFPKFRIKNHLGETILRIEGPFCRYAICGDVEFKILSLTGEEVGKISKQWSGLARELFTDADFFGISFPLDLDVRVKASLLGALFLIDMMFFEKSGNKESDGPGMI